MQKRLILGSSSPRRAQVLSYFDIPFKVMKPPFDEESAPVLPDPAHYVQLLATEKARSLDLPHEIIITADTIVEKEGKIFGKPRDEAHALEILEELNGSWHQVMTAVCVKQDARIVCKVASTRILFHQMTPSQLLAYHRCFHGRDKAGGYGLQEGGSILVKKIEGCFYSVLGLPITELVQTLQEFGIDLWEHLKQS